MNLMKEKVDIVASGYDDFSTIRAKASGEIL